MIYSYNVLCKYAQLKTIGISQYTMLVQMMKILQFMQHIIDTF